MRATASRLFASAQARAPRLRRHVLFQWPQLADSAESPPSGANNSATAIPLTLEHRDDLIALRGHAVSNEIMNHLGQGDAGIAVHVDGRLVAHGLAHRTPVDDYTNRYLATPAGVSALHYFYVSPSVRGAGIFQLALYELTKGEVARGARAVWVDVSIANSPSLGGVRRVGFTELGTITFVTAFGQVLFRRRSLRRALEFE